MAHAKMLALTDSEIVELETIIRQRTNQAQIVDRSKMLLYKSQRMTNGEIAERLDVYCKDRISSHSKSSIIAKSGIRTLRQRCMRFRWYISRSKCSLMKMAI